MTRQVLPERCLNPAIDELFSWAVLDAVGASSQLWAAAMLRSALKRPQALWNAFLAMPLPGRAWSILHQSPSGAPTGSRPPPARRARLEAPSQTSPSAAWSRGPLPGPTPPSPRRAIHTAPVETEKPKGTPLDSHAIGDEETGKRLADKALGFFRRNRPNAKPLQRGVRNAWTRRKRGIMAHGRSS